MSTKSYLSIGDVLSGLREEFPDVTISKIRFLETQGLVTPQRSPSGYRKFLAGDVDRLRWILQQQRDHFFPLKVIKERIEEAFPAQPATNGSRPPQSDEQRAAALARVSHVVAALQEGPRAVAQVGPSFGQGDRPVAAEEVVMEVPNPPQHTVSLAELCALSGLSEAEIAQAESVALLSSTEIAGEVVFADDAIAVAKLVGQFRRYGMEPRHLRPYANAIDREIGLIEQVVNPLLRAHTPEARQRAAEHSAELAKLGQSLRAALLRRALSKLLGS